MSRKHESYADKLRRPEWQKKRLEILERDGWKCRDCGDTASQLHVHHVYYIKGRSPWEYDDSALKTLCEACHAETEAAKNVLLCSMKEFQWQELHAISALCDALTVIGHERRGMILSTLVGGKAGDVVMFAALQMELLAMSYHTGLNSGRGVNAERQP